MDKKNVAALVVVAVLFGFLLGRLSTHIGDIGGGPGFVESDLARFVLDDPGQTAAASELLPLGEAPFLGRGAAKVTMVLFTEFQCQYSRRVLGSLMELFEGYEDGDLRLVFMNFPLDLHPLAVPAAKAALAAHEQGEFWAYHDLLFNNQNRFEPESLLEYAETLGLQMHAFRDAMSREEYDDRITNEQSVGAQLGVRGTPSFLINGRLVMGSKSAADFRQIVDEEIHEANALIAAGVPLTEIHRMRVEANLTGEDVNHPAEATVTESGAARVQLAVFADFTDPRYQPLAQTLSRLMAELGESLDVSFTSVVDVSDPRAVLTSAAFRAAQAQERWPEFHAALVETGDAVDRETLLAVAQTIGLDLDLFLQVLDDQSSAQLAQAELEVAQRRGVVATPAVFIGGQRLVGSVPYGDLRELIDAELTQR